MGNVIPSLRDFKKHKRMPTHIHNGQTFMWKNLLPLRFFWGFLRYFFREIGDLFLYFRGIRRLRENL